MGESGGRRQGLGSRCNAMERTSLIWKGTKWPPRSAETQRWVACHTIRDRCMRISEQQSALDRRLTSSTAALCAPPAASQKAEEKSLRAPLLRKTFGPRPTQEKYIWRAYMVDDSQPSTMSSRTRTMESRCFGKWGRN